jgi:acyl-CoA synthetase (AMP-forming)/AMP-acid ligase II
VPLPAGPKSDRLAAAVTDCAPAAAVIDAATAREIDAQHPLAAVRLVFVAGRRGSDHEYPAHFVALSDALDAVSPEAPRVRVIDIDLAAIIYTSGSTGEPRGVMLTHRNFVANARSIVQYLGLTERDRVMCVLPFSYVYGLSLLHTHVAVGGSVVIDNRFAFPNVVLAAMREHGVTGFAGVPSTFALLLHRSNLDTTTLPSLRYVTQAGGAMPPARIQEWLARGPKVPFYVMYGATEAAARLTYLDPARLGDKLGSIGKPIPNVDITIIKDDGTVADPGDVGELVARGSNIARGYWNDPAQTRERFGPLGYRTGDLGYADEDGFLFLVGRRHDMLKVGAHRVGTREIEDVLADCPGVLEAAVVGAPHDLLGEVPVAFVAVRDGESTDTCALEAFCQSRLPSHKVPAKYVIRAELPKLGGAGKIDKGALREFARAPS